MKLVLKISSHNFIMANKISSNKLIRDRMSVCITIEDKNTDYTVEKTSALAPGSLSWILIRVLTTASTFVEWLPFESKEENTLLPNKI